MNILGIDYGKKRIGLAWVNTDLGVVLPYGVIELGKLGNREIRKLEKLIELIHKEKIDQIVIGLPIGLDGKENENTKAVDKFIRELKSDLSAEASAQAGVRIPIAIMDERFTSAEADRMGGDATRDEKAAMLILQAYLDQKRV